jgi:hypothetical protein
VQDEAADDRKHDDEGEAHVQIRARLAKILLYVVLDIRPQPHANGRRGCHHQPELQVNVPELVALVRADQRLGELVAQVARHRDDAGHAHAHHSRRQHEGAARADEPAHQPADESDREQGKHIAVLQIDKLDCCLFHRLFLPALDAQDLPETGGEDAMREGEHERSNDRQARVPSIGAREGRQNLPFVKVEQKVERAGGDA